MQERQLLLIELLEELLPRNLLERVCTAVTGKVDPQNTRVVRIAGATHMRWLSAALFGPATNGLVIGRDLAGAAAARRFLTA